MLDGNKFKIYASCKTEETAQAEPGTVVPSAAKKGLWVCCGDGRLLRLVELQAPGSKRMTAEAYLLGHQIAEGAVFGK